MQLNNKYLNLKVILGLLVAVILISFFVHAGTYQIDSQGNIVENSYSIIDNYNLNFHQILSAPIDGFIGVDNGETISTFNQGNVVGAISLVFLILSIGAFMYVCEQLNILNDALIKIVNKNISITKITIFVSLFFILCASSHGMYETTIAYIPILIGTYKVYNVSKEFVLKLMLYSLAIGHIGGLTNPFATIIASDISGIPFSQGILLRIILLVILTLFTLFILIKDLNKEDLIVPKKEKNYESKPKLKINIILMTITYLIMIISFLPGKILIDFDMTEISMIFIIMSFIIGKINKLSFDQIIEYNFVGFKQYLLVGFAVGFARSIYVILYNSKTIDTIIYHLNNFYTVQSIVVIIVFLSFVFLLFSFLIPSTSALANTLMPIISSSLILSALDPAMGVTIYQSMCGVLKVISVTSPLLVALLTYAEVSYTRWVKISYKYTISIYIISIGTTIIYYS